MPVEQCQNGGCKMQARVAIRTKRGSGAKRGELTHTIYMDNRTAPKIAARYCVTHGARLASDLVYLGDRDELMPSTV